MYQVDKEADENDEKKVVTLRKHETTINGNKVTVIIVRDITDSVRFME